MVNRPSYPVDHHGCKNCGCHVHCVTKVYIGYEDSYLEELVKQSIYNPFDGIWDSLRLLQFLLLSVVLCDLLLEFVFPSIKFKCLDVHEGFCGLLDSTIH